MFVAGAARRLREPQGARVDPSVRTFLASRGRSHWPPPRPDYIRDAPEISRRRAEPHVFIGTAFLPASSAPLLARNFSAELRPMHAPPSTAPPRDSSRPDAAEHRPQPAAESEPNLPQRSSIQICLGGLVRRYGLIFKRRRQPTGPPSSHVSRLPPHHPQEGDDAVRHGPRVCWVTRHQWSISAAFENRVTARR